MLITNDGLFEGILAAGLRLADLPESEGGWKEYFSVTDKADLSIKDDMLRAQTALMLENTKRWLATKCGGRRALTSDGRWLIDETTRSALVGGFSDYLFPIIRAGFPTNPVNELVSVQPTSRRIATIVYWNWIVGKTKGSYVQGQRLFDANTGKQSSGYNFSNEVIDSEAITALGGANATNSGTLAYKDGGGVRPGTVRITATLTTAGAGIVFVDNGQGIFISAGATVGSSSIDYVTGAWSITVTGDTFTTASTNTATYRWDSEGSASVPEVDIQIVTSTAETERRALRINYSQESMQDVLAEMGVSLEPQLVSGCAEQMNDEIARQIVSEIWRVAPVNSTFNKTGPTEYSQQEHFRDIVLNLNAASNNIQFRTRKGYANWCVVDEQGSNIIESLPAGMFVAAPRPANVQGLHFIGTLLNKYRVYKDLRLINETSASSTGNMLLGFKGTQFFEAGFVWAPYQLLYTTPTLQTADFLSQKGMASRYATKMVNQDMYVRIDIGA
jgi:hypothetical protein